MTGEEQVNDRLPRDPILIPHMVIYIYTYTHTYIYIIYIYTSHSSSMYHRLFSEKAIFFFTGEEQVNTVSHDPILPPHGHTSHEFETVLVMSHFPFVLYVSPPFLRRGGGVFFF